MRLWEQCLRRDTEAFTDFLTWLADMADRELRKMLVCGPDKHDYQRGLHDGINTVRFQASVNQKDETQRALHAAREKE